MRLLCFAVFCSFLALYWSVFAFALWCFVVYLYRLSCETVSHCLALHCVLYCSALYLYGLPPETALPSMVLYWFCIVLVCTCIDCHVRVSCIGPVLFCLVWQGSELFCLD